MTVSLITGSCLAVCTQDHGLYFDLDDELRLNYARLWLALIAPGFPPVARARRKYAEAMNITSDLVRSSLISYTVDSIVPVSDLRICNYWPGGP